MPVTIGQMTSEVVSTGSTASPEGPSPATPVWQRLKVRETTARRLERDRERTCARGLHD